MIRLKFLKYLAFISLILLTPLSSCGPKYKAAKAQRVEQKRAEQKRQEGERAMEKGREKHINAQSRETRKRMKETRRKSERLNKSRKPPFYVRWFNAIRKKR